MTFLVFLSLSILAFLVGFFAGVHLKNKNEEQKTEIKVLKTEEETILNEFYNFLNYDGSEQS